ncbi:hypothetical protein FQR65_LT02895 [Abscondita terminalis]|nr:hypothetical protein FQR65_LT02895 [Abscondita terminalis]
MSHTDIDTSELSNEIEEEFYEEIEDEYEEEGEIHEKEEEEQDEEKEFEEESEEETEEEPDVFYLKISYSYGYDCKKYYNLVTADEDTIVFTSGNYMVFFDVPTRTPTFRRSAFGKGVGHITKNPNPEYSHLAVGENGAKPPIIIYEWPGLEIVCLLKGGALKCFSHLNYSPDGSLLVSQSGEPDFLITIFNWQESVILLRTKSNVHEVFRVMFSPEVPGQLTTCGLSHIKFWKMASTFTGLKLQGELGRFGKTEYSDILGIYPMPDEKVVSGSFWGNMLVWDEGLISLEVCQVNRKPLHNGPITQFYYDNGDLWSVGMDGYVRVWFYDSIDQADPPDYDRTVELEPLQTFHVPGCNLMSIQKVNDKWKDFQFYAQDGNGGIWLIDLTTFAEPKRPVQLFRCHAGAIMDIAACPWGPYLVSLGVDGRMQLYNYENRKLLYRYRFPAKGVTITWLPINMQPSGDELILGFDDGLVRVVILSIDEENETYNVQLIQRSKPHNKPITKSAINETDFLLVTAAEDSNIFIFQLKREQSSYTFLHPIGFIPLPGTVTYVMWHPNLKATVLAGCNRGHFIQVKVPVKPPNYTKVTYVLRETPIIQLFLSYKSQILRDIRLAELDAIKKAKLKRKQAELKRLKAENEELDIDEDEFLADSEEDEELEPLFIPETPNKVLWMQVTPNNSIWLSMDGYDCGYIYEYYMDKITDIPARYTLICDGDQHPIVNYVYNADMKYLILAIDDGSLRVVKVNQKNWRDLSDYWKLGMHDMHNEPYYPPILGQRPKLAKPVVEIEDSDGYTMFSLDENLIKAEEERINKIANENKNTYLDKIHTLKNLFQEMLIKNSKLLPTQIIPRSKLDVDPRISEDLEKRLQTNLSLVKKKLEYNVEKSRVRMQKLKKHFIDPLDVFPIMVKAVNKDVSVAVMRQRKLSSKFHHMLGIIEQKIRESDDKMKPPEQPPQEVQSIIVSERIKKPLEYFLTGLSSEVIEHGLEPRLARCLQRYRERKEKLDLRRKEWSEFTSLKPQSGLNNPEDEIKISEAESKIGDFKLKSALDYKVPHELRESTMKKYKQLLFARLRQYTLKHDFNMLVLKLRNEKTRLNELVSKLTPRLQQINDELDLSLRKEVTSIPTIQDEDFVEKHLSVEVNVQPTDDAKDVIPVLSPLRGDILENEVLLTSKPLIPLISSLNLKGMPSKITATVSDSEIEALCEDTDTPWEAEIRDYRLSRNLFEQEEIIKKISKVIKDFDEKVLELSEKKITLRRDSDLLDLHILTLNQELHILKKFEIVEDSLHNKVHARFAETLQTQNTITNLNNNVDKHKVEVDRLQNKENSIWQAFSLMVAENKFYDFLRRIFKKKYRPPKVRNPDESSSSSESSESSESEQGDAASVDSRDFGIIKLDENVCPKGCNPNVYAKTFELRTERHGIEMAIRDEKTIIESLLKDMEFNKKKLKGIQTLLQDSQKELESYQREKQKMLNMVECTVLIKMNQLQHLISENRSSKISETLVFPKQALSKLYKRVGQLHNENLEVKLEHRSNLEHMTRMGTDYKYMQQKLAQINLDMKDLMFKKFGQEIDFEDVEEYEMKTLVFGRAINLDDLEETNMRKTVFQFRVKDENVGNLYADEIRTWIAKCEEKQGELVEILKLNTAKLDLMALLNKEKRELADMFHSQMKNRKNKKIVPDKFITTFQDDVDKLKTVLKQQHYKIRMLQLEIRRLKTKGFIIEHKKEKPKEPEVFEDDSFEYTYPVIEKKPFRLNLELPFVDLEEKFSIPMTVKQIVKSIIIEMVDSIKIASLSKFVKEDLIEQLIYDIMRRPSVEQISDNLQALLPDEPNDEQKGVIDTAADKIFALQQPGQGSHETISSNVLLNSVIDSNIECGGSVSQVMSNIISELVAHLPIDFLLNDSSVHTIIGKVNSHMQLKKFSKEQLISSILAIRSTRTAEMQMLVDKILETVYATGMDYLYFIAQ